MSQLVTVSSSHDTAPTDADSSKYEGTVNHSGNPHTRKRLLNFNSFMTERLFYGCLEEGSKNSTKEVYVFTPVILLVVWLVCRQDYRETTERIFTELG